MLKNVIAWFLLIAFLLPCQAFALARNHSGTVVMAFDLSAHEKGKEAELWIPYPVSDMYQTITDVKVGGDFATSAVYTDNTNGTPMLYAKWGKNGESRKLTFSFRAERREVIRRDFPAQEAAWDPADYAQYLKGNRLGPLDGKIEKLARSITAGKTSVLEKAKAIYDWTCDNMYREPKTRGCGEGDVCALLAKPGGKCADIHSVFVALARAAGVPAREIFGIRLGKKPVEDITGWQHCWAEFYLPGYGWVPVDAADVRKAMLTENLTLKDARTAEYRAYFWGGIDACRVRLSIGRDIILNPPHKGAPINYLMYPYAQVGGRVLDWLDPATFKYTITYTEK